MTRTAGSNAATVGGSCGASGRPGSPGSWRVASPYRDYDHETGSPGDIFDPENPVNDSPNNDGLTELPSARGAAITSPYNWGSLLEYPTEWGEYVPCDSIDEVPSRR